MNFHINLALVCAYLLWRFVIPLPFSRTIRLVIGAFLLIISSYHLIIRVIFGTMFSAEMPYSLVYSAGAAFTTVVLLFILTLLVDLVSLISKLFAIFRRRNLLNNHTRFYIAALAIVMAQYGAYQAVKVPEVKQVEIEVSGLPEALEGYRIVQLTDLHISKLFPADWVQRVVERTNQTQADLILVTGDLIDGTIQARKADVAPLNKLSARQGVVAILGNHEFYFDQARWRREFERLGITVLMNEHVAIGDGDRQIVIAGVNDEVAVEYGIEGPNVKVALKGAPQGRPIILLKHRPEASEASAQAEVDIQLSGHTHGGMIKGVDLVAAYVNQGFVSGKYSLANMTLYVSNGVALWSGFPIRIGVPAEITSIVLRRR